MFIWWHVILIALNLNYVFDCDRPFRMELPSCNGLASAVLFCYLLQKRSSRYKWHRLLWPTCLRMSAVTGLSHTHTRLTALCPGLPRWADTRKVKPIWILLKQETVSDSVISWAVCKSAPRSRQITTPAPHHSVFSGRMPFLPPNRQCQCT